MTSPAISPHFLSREPSEIRKAQILFAERQDRDEVDVINLAIGNVSRAMHPALQKRMKNLGSEGPFQEGVVRYSASVGSEESQAAFRRILEIDGIDASNLHHVVTDGGSMAMELMVLGTSGPAGKRPILLLEPAYTNYKAMAARCDVKTVSVARVLDDEGEFLPPDLAELERTIQKENPSVLVVIPADNPSGQYLSQSVLKDIATLCVKYGVWICSDEAYRQLHYTGDKSATSIWAFTNDDVPGIEGTRLGIESASKVWNACGLRVGALITDNAEFHKRCVAEYTANLCSNVIGQYIFGALAHESIEDLQKWCNTQRAYYQSMMQEVGAGLKAALPGLIVSKPDASLYSVLDVRKVCDAEFSASAFVAKCATVGKETIEGRARTLLVSPMAGFYTGSAREKARTQMRMAFVDSPENMKVVPALFAKLFASHA